MKLAGWLSSCINDRSIVLIVLPYSSTFNVEDHVAESADVIMS